MTNDQVDSRHGKSTNDRTQEVERSEEYEYLTRCFFGQNPGFGLRFGITITVILALTTYDFHPNYRKVSRFRDAAFMVCSNVGPVYGARRSSCTLPHGTLGAVNHHRLRGKII